MGHNHRHVALSRRTGPESALRPTAHASLRDQPEAPGRVGKDGSRAEQVSLLFLLFPCLPIKFRVLDKAVT